MKVAEEPHARGILRRAALIAGVLVVLGAVVADQRPWVLGVISGGSPSWDLDVLAGRTVR